MKKEKHEIKAEEVKEEQIKTENLETIENTENKTEEETKLEKEEKTTESNETNNFEEEKKALTEKIQSLEKELAEAKDKRLRTLAEFENYKKRTQNEISDFYKYASENMIKKILPIYDDLSRSLGHIPEDLKENPFVNGIKMVYDKFTKILSDEGVKKIETIGRQFDFNFHEALLRQPNNQAKHDEILQEIEAGYIYKDKVIRHAKVIVCVNENNEEQEVINNQNTEQN